MEISWLSVADANTRWVLAGTMLLGLSSGVLGSFALLRRRSLMGDTLAHAALPGVCIAYLLTGAKSIGSFLVGAAIAGILGVLAVSAVTRYSKIKEDAAMGLVLTVFFGGGMMLLSVIQRSPDGNQSGLDKFLFGQAAAMVGSDVQVIAAIAGLLCLVVALLFKEFKLLSFDPGFAAGVGLPVGVLDLLLHLLIVLAVVIGLQAVGVVLMAAMLITPAVSARYWTDRLSLMAVLAGLFGAMSGAAGTLLSQAGARMPTGPLIVLTATALFLISLLFAPKRGLVARTVRRLRIRRQVARENALRALYELAEEAGLPGAAFTAETLVRRRGLTGRDLPGLLARLAGEGLLKGSPQGWALSAEGLKAAYGHVRERRLYEVYLMHQHELAGAQVEPDGAVRFPAWVREELEELVRMHGLEPRLTPAGVAREGA